MAPVKEVFARIDRTLRRGDLAAHEMLVVMSVVALVQPFPSASQRRFRTEVAESSQFSATSARARCDRTVEREARTCPDISRQGGKGSHWSTDRKSSPFLATHRAMSQRQELEFSLGRVDDVMGGLGPTRRASDDVTRAGSVPSLPEA